MTEDPVVKDDWRTRKIAHLKHIRDGMHADTALVAICDKIANLNDLVNDFEHASGGEATLERFNGKAIGTRAYYVAMLEVLTPFLAAHPDAVANFEALLTRLGGPAVPVTTDPIQDFMDQTLSLAAPTDGAAA